jgi:hypothetical protein
LGAIDGEPVAGGCNMLGGLGSPGFGETGCLPAVIIALLTTAAVLALIFLVWWAILFP